MTTKLFIRRASPWDVIKVTRLLAQGANEQRKDIWYASPSDNPMRQISHVLALIDVGLVVVAEAKEDKRIVAALGFQIGRNEWSDDWELSNEWMYVLPSYRATDVADRMLTFAEHFADLQVDPETKQGLPVIMAVWTGDKAEVKDKLLERRGYVYGGGNFIRKPARDMTNDKVNESDESEIRSTADS